MQIKEKILQILEKSLDGLGIERKGLEIIVDVPNNLSNGDYTSNIAMQLSSVLKKNPFDIANEIVEKLEKDPDIEKVEVARPGFINFFVSRRFLLTELSKIVEKGGEYFKLEEKKGKKIVIEYTDPNPFKILHIGHLYTNTVGESLARLQESLGAEVKRANYQGDVGLHVAKTLWGLEKKLTDEKVSFSSIEERALEERVKYLGEAYVLGSEYYDELKDEVAISEIDEINYYIFSMFIKALDKKDFSKYEQVSMYEKYTKGRQWCLEYFEKIYEILGSKFDYYFFESEVGESGLKIVLENVGKVFVSDAGAVIYRGDEAKNLHTRVFVNKYGVPTYEAKEIGLAFRKSESVDFDESIVITANEQSGYFRVVLDALMNIDSKLASRTKHISHGMIKLPGAKKMSSRKGGVVEAEWLINETKDRVEKIMLDSGKFEEDSVSDIALKVSIGAIKYAFLRIGIGKDIVFDFDKSVTFDGETGPYIMYVYSRCSSILEDVESLGSSNLCLDMCLDNPYTLELVRSVGSYREALLAAALNYSPSILSQYLFTLAQKFNTFYQNVRVLDAEEDERKILLLLVRSVMIVIEDGLRNLGINVVQKM